MARRLHIILSWPVHSTLASAVKWTGPSSTHQSKHPHVTRASLATKAPSLATRAPIDITSTYEAPHVCGYVNFDLNNPYTCANSNTCLWNSHLKIVGCGNPTAINYITSCVPHRDLDDCDDDCFANPSIIRCGSDLPHCNTPRVGPSRRYSILVCQSTHHQFPDDVHMVYRGQKTIGHLPRWLGDDGNITYGTRIPHGFSVTAASRSLTFQETEIPYSTSISTAGITKMGTGSMMIINGVVVQKTQSSAPDPDVAMSAVYVQQQTHKEIVAGSVIGSLMGLVVVLFVVGVLIAWRKKVAREEKVDEMIDLREMESGERGNLH